MSDARNNPEMLESEPDTQEELQPLLTWAKCERAKKDAIKKVCMVIEQLSGFDKKSYKELERKAYDLMQGDKFETEYGTVSKKIGGKRVTLVPANSLKHAQELQKSLILITKE